MGHKIKTEIQDHSRSNYIKSVCLGRMYGDGYMQGDGQLGQVVKVAGHNRFAVNTDPTVKSFGILMGDYKDGEHPGIYFMGGIYKTNVFNGWVEPGDGLVTVNGKLTAENFQVGEEELIAQAIAVGDAWLWLTFQLLI